MAARGKIESDPYDDRVEVAAERLAHEWIAPTQGQVRLPPPVNTWANSTFCADGVQGWLRRRYDDSLADLTRIERQMQAAIEKQQQDDRRSAFMALLVQARGAWRQLEHVRSLIAQTSGAEVPEPSVASWSQWRIQQFARFEQEELRRAA